MLPETVYLHIVFLETSIHPPPRHPQVQHCLRSLHRPASNLSRIWWPDCLDVASKRVPPLRKHITWESGASKAQPNDPCLTHILFFNRLFLRKSTSHRTLHFEKPIFWTIFHPVFYPPNGSINKALFGDMLLLHLEKSEEVSQEIVHWIAFTSRKHLRSSTLQLRSKGAPKGGIQSVNVMNEVLDTGML